MSLSDLFHNEEFIALKDSLGLVPTFSSCWDSSAQIAYRDSVLDSLRESERLETQNAVLRALSNRNRNKKNGIDVFATKDYSLQIPFE